MSWTLFIQIMLLIITTVLTVGAAIIEIKKARRG